jgi:hypothetical protein
VDARRLATTSTLPIGRCVGNGHARSAAEPSVRSKYRVRGRYRELPLRVAACAIALAALAGCGSSSSSAATTTTAATAAAKSPSGASGGGGGAGGGGGTPSSHPTPTPAPTAGTLPTSTEPDTSSPTAPGFGPYTVKQTQTLGGESINGQVCDVRIPFSVNAATSKVAWAFVFRPIGDGGTGNFSYSYNIPSAGESHQGTGSYKVSNSDQSGTRQVSLAGSDHVVFKGFDGNIPVRYKFDLVPGRSCGAG